MSTRNATSFICEHSAEFVLIPHLTQLFSAHKQDLLPLYFWKNREGGQMSRRCDPGKPIRLLAMYARRPKVSEPGQDCVSVKINDALFERAHYLKENGIPTIAAVPLVSSIMDLRIGCPCSWFTLCPDRDFESDVEFTIDIKSEKCDIELPAGVQGPLEDAELLRLFDKSEDLKSWQDAIEILRADRLDHGFYRNSFYWRMGMYKPVYLLSR
jgi:hypothetical protein